MLGIIAVSILIFALIVVALIWLINHGNILNYEETTIVLILAISISYSLMLTYIIHIFGYI